MEIFYLLLKRNVILSHTKNRKYLLNSLPKDSLFALSASYRCFPSFIKAPAHCGRGNT